MEAYDVIVLGLGIMGSATAYQLAQRGKKVLGLEQFGPTHSNGSSHGRSRIIRQAYFEDPAYVPLLQRSYELWDDLQRQSDKEIIRLTGGLMLGRPESAPVAGSLRSAQEYGLPHELLDAKDLRKRFPTFNVSDATVGLYETRAGVVYPENSILAFQQLAAKHGAELHFEEPVTSWEAASSGEGVVVTTPQGRYEAASIVLSAGAWMPQQLAELNLPLQPERQVLYWFDPVGSHELFTPSRFPIFIWELDNGLQFYGFPFDKDDMQGGVKVGYFRLEDACTPENIDRIVHDDEIAHIRACVAENMPAANGRLIDTATCMYTTTPDHHFILSAHPQHEQVIIASPCSGHGFKFGSVIGEILADLATERTTRHPVDLFSVGRFSK